MSLTPEGDSPDHPIEYEHKPVVRRRHEGERRDPDTVNQEHAVLENLLARVELLERAMVQVLTDVETLAYIIDVEDEDGDMPEGLETVRVTTPEEWEGDGPDGDTIAPDGTEYPDAEDDAQWAANEAERLRHAAEQANELDAEPGSPKGFNDLTQEEIDAQGS